MKYSKCFLHVDMDAFFASVEQLDHPEWKGKPVIVGGLPGEPRSVVSTASYEARKYGVHSAMPVVQAVKLCPNGIYTHGNYKRYSEISEKIMSILRKYSPDVNQISIDEASLEITGTEMLFGPPDDLAKKIQEEVFETTGLTVSAGLASTAYLAKLSSEVNKPNGFFAIPEGEEEKFMLSLPLKKVWGIGDKTLQRLNKAGFFTTMDIHQKPLDLLKMMFGESTGNFLYNTVRGKETEGSVKHSTHSISNETTFPVDLSDIYTAETAILELCYSVMFRLLEEKSFSRTVMVKIRYEDFTTISVQQTFEDYISSTDDLFEKAKSLFEKKYEFGRGIRLLGIALENVQDETAPVQEVLFDFGAKKKKAVENAILKMSARHPEIQVKKARMIKPGAAEKLTVLAAAFLLSTLGAARISSEEYINKVSQTSAGAINSTDTLLALPLEAPRTLFDYTINSQEIEFLAQGWWQGNLTGGFTTTYSSDDGLSTSSPDIIFQQKVDMSLWFMLNRQWYFEGSFADEFTKNTIAAGFYGKDGNPLKEFRIANRGISFPDTYSISLFNRGIGGGDNQAPGFKAVFEDPVSSRWKADFALRYDMVSQQDATFYGKNSVSTTTISLSDYITGQFFALPENSGLIESLKAVYVQNSSGTYSDSEGRKYKKLSSDQYVTVASRNMVVISKDAGISKNGKKIPAIIFEFESEPDFESILGSYENSSTFLGKIQQIFGSTVKLQNFSYTYTEKIEGRTALLVQNSTGFSPFTFANYYDAGIASKAEIILGSSATEEPVSDYSAEITEDFESFLTSSFINEKHIYAEVFAENSTTTDYSAPENRYPLAKILPGIYLNYSENTDLALLSRIYTPVSSFSIGTDAAAGSVRVYKNGIPENSAKYDEESGSVIISSSVSDLDKIYITWNEDSGSAENGAIAAEAGFSANITPALKTDFAAAVNWTVSPYADYAEYQRAASGYASVSSGISWNKENIQLSNAVAATYENPNVTGFYRIDGFDDCEAKTYYPGKTGIYLLPSDFSPSLNIEGTSTVLSSEYNFTANSSSQNGVSDSSITGYKLPLEWDFSSAESGTTPWAAINFSLSAGSLLHNADTFRIALQAEDSVLDQYNIYLQLGVEASDEPEPEYASKTATWLLEDFSRDAELSQTQKENNWHTATIQLQNSQLSAISEYTDARLIVVPKDSSTLSLTEGTIYAGPYEIVSKGILYAENSDFEITTEQLEENSVPEKKTFNGSSDNIAQKISWSPSSSYSDNTEITLARYFSEADFSNYQNFNFYIKEAEFKSLQIILDRNAADIESDGKTALKATVSQSVISSITKSDWHKISVDLKNKKVEIDGAAVSEEESSVYVNTSVIPNRFKMIFVPENSEDEFYIDELNLSGTTSDFIFEDKADFNVEKKGTILKIRNHSVAENAYFHTEQNAEASVKEDNSSSNGSLSSVTGAGITVLGVSLSADAAFSSSQEKIVSSASHSIETEHLLFGIAGFKDSFIFNPADSSTEKLSSAGIDFNRFKVPLKLSASAKDSKNRWSFTNGLSAEETFALHLKSFELSLNTSASAEQKLPVDDSEISDIETKNYFEEYRNASQDSFSLGKSNATQRKLSGKTTLSASIKPLCVKPSVCFEASEKYLSSSSVKYSDLTSITSELPFTFKNHSVSLKYVKSGGTTVYTESGGDYSEDLSQMCSSLKNQEYFYKAAPFYDLFSSELSESLSEKSVNSDTESANYSGLYSFSWKRKISADLKDLFIPGSFDFSAQRSLVSSSTLSDTYVLKASVMNTPFNLFGSQSRLKLFSWYKTDEYAFSFTGTAKIPKTEPSGTIWQAGVYGQAGFYLNDSDVLKTGAQFELETDLSWNTKATFLYKRQKQGKHFSKLTKTDSFDLTFDYDKDDSELTQDYKYAHKNEAEITAMVSASAGIEAELKISDSVTTLIPSATVGGKVTF